MTYGRSKGRQPGFTRPAWQKVLLAISGRLQQLNKMDKRARAEARAIAGVRA